MNEGEDKVAKRQKRAIRYKRDVASGKQKAYNSQTSARRQNLLREEKVARARQILMASNKMHLEGAVATTIRTLPKRTVIKDTVIWSCIRKCERELELRKMLAAAHASDATTVANASSGAVKSNNDTSGEPSDH